MLNFEDFFDTDIEYPGNKIGSSEILPMGTLYTYISSTFASCFLNYAGTAVRAYVLARYQAWDEPLDELVELNIQEPAGSFNWVKRTFTTKAAIFEAFSEPRRDYHTDLSKFEDAVLALFKTGEDVYWYFWLDQDSSDCCIGRFITSESTEAVIQSFDAYVLERNAEASETTSEARLLPTHCFAGWIKF